MAKKGLVLTVLGLFLCATISSNVLATSEVYFNQPVDKRFAWLNNDAHGEVDFKAKIIDLINSAEKSVDICTMSFGGVNEIADALVAAANKGIKVRVICDGGKRFQDGMERVLRGPVQVADNNLPALYCKINFQKKDSSVPEGFLADYGEAYALRNNGYTYGWVSSDISNGEIVKSASTQYTTSLLKDVYTIRNTKSAKWQIKLPNGYYYVLVNVGRDDSYDKGSYYNYIKVQNEQIHTYKEGDTLKYSDYRKTNPGEFSCSIVDGGKTGNVYNSKRVQVKNGVLTVTVGGNTTYDTLTALDFIEIYRAKNNPETDKKYVQNRQLQHSKYIIIDGGTNKAQLWTGSGNLTTGMINLSEDAILTNEKGICNAFYKEFNHMWGGSQLVPNPSDSAFGKFKTAMNTETYSISNPLLSVPNSFDWQVHFSPSKPAFNLYTDLSKFISASKHNLIMLMEQWSDGGDVNYNLGNSTYVLRGSTYLMDHDLGNYINSGKPFYGIFGNTSATDSIFTKFTNNQNAHISGVKKIDNNDKYNIHDKIALSDAYRDTRYAKRGSVLFGSMNWSQSGMHYNDEQTVIIKDPAIANQYLQRAMAALDREGMMPPSNADIVLVLDRSFSMVRSCANTDKSRVDAMKTAAKLFVDLLASDGKHRMSVVRFGTSVENNKYADTEVLNKLTSQYADMVKNEIDSISITSGENISSWTCYGLALQAALDRFENNPSNNRKLVVFFTDGEENRAPKASTVYPQLVDKNIEIHSIGFGNFNLFVLGNNSVLADMATASAGTFAQMEADEILLKKRFAEIACDIMDSSVILDPEYELTKKSLKVNFDVPESVDSIQVLQLNDSETFVPDMKLSASKQKLTNIIELKDQDSGYKIFDLKSSDLPQIVDSITQLELKADQKVEKKYKGKLSLMILAKAPTTMKAEVVADKAGQKEVTLLCRMLQNNDAVKDAKITAEWTTPVSSENVTKQTVTLYDDGNNGDGQANDGLFGAKLTLNDPGNHSFHFTAISSKDSRIDFVKEQIKSEKKRKALASKVKVRRETTVYYMVNK